MIIALVVMAGVGADECTAKVPATAPADRKADAPPLQFSNRPDTPKWVENFFEACSRRYHETVADLEAKYDQSESTLADVQSAKISRSKSRLYLTFPSASDKRVAIARSKKKMEDVKGLLEKAKAEKYPKTNFEAVDVIGEGMFGRLTFKLVQIVDDENSIVETTNGETLWLASYPTKGMADEHRYALDVAVSETKQYRTVLGATKTVMVIRPFSLSDWLKVPTTAPARR